MKIYVDGKLVATQNEENPTQHGHEIKHSVSEIKHSVPEIKHIFPTPVYHTHRELGLDLLEKKDIEDIIKEGMQGVMANSFSNDTYIFDTKLAKLKEFCEQHIENYVKRIISPKKELDFYITQSWLNITKPGQFHHQHSHPNSIISGVFYITTVENDQIVFHDPNNKLKQIIQLDPTASPNAFNSDVWMGVKALDFLLFPSWLEHSVKPNEKATTDRISISFNTFVKGTIGIKDWLTELMLKEGTKDYE